MQQEPNGLQILEIIIYAAFAGIAGLLGHTLRTLESGGQLTMFRSFAEMAGAALVGVLTLMACKALALDTMWTGVTVGVMAWLGANASIRVLEKMVYQRLGIKPLIVNPTPAAVAPEGDDQEGR